jgi:hypothetical protein
MNSLQKSASKRSSISASSSSRGKFQNQTKLQDPVTMIISAATPCLCIASILRVVGHQGTGRGISNHIQRKETQGPSSKDPPPPYSQRGRAPNYGCGCDRGPYTVKCPYCMYHNSETNHRTKDCSIFLETKRKMDQEPTQRSPQPPP